MRSRTVHGSFKDLSIKLPKLKGQIGKNKNKTKLKATGSNDGCNIISNVTHHYVDAHYYSMNYFKMTAVTVLMLAILA